MAPNGKGKERADTYHDQLCAILRGIVSKLDPLLQRSSPPLADAQSHDDIIGYLDTYLTDTNDPLPSILQDTRHALITLLQANVRGSGHPAVVRFHKIETQWGEGNDSLCYLSKKLELMLELHATSLPIKTVLKLLRTIHSIEEFLENWKLLVEIIEFREAVRASNTYPGLLTIDQADQGAGALSGILQGTTLHGAHEARTLPSSPPSALPGQGTSLHGAHEARTLPSSPPSALPGQGTTLHGDHEDRTLPSSPPSALPGQGTTLNGDHEDRTLPLSPPSALPSAGKGTSTRDWFLEMLNFWMWMVGLIATALFAVKFTLALHSEEKTGTSERVGAFGCFFYFVLGVLASVRPWISGNLTRTRATKYFFLPFLVIASLAAVAAITLAFFGSLLPESHLIYDMLGLFVNGAFGYVSNDKPDEGPSAEDHAARRGLRNSADIEMAVGWSKATPPTTGESSVPHRPHPLARYHPDLRHLTPRSDVAGNKTHALAENDTRTKSSTRTTPDAVDRDQVGAQFQGSTSKTGASQPFHRNDLRIRM